MKNEFLWWRDGIIYQIYPRSFADSNNDGIGDLPGITNKLDYLQDLGVDAIWLSPIYPSPDVDFGYDVSDYMGIDPKFGTMEDFEKLVREAKKRDIHIIMDLVLNHTSDQHPWFIASKESEENPYHDWYLWLYPKSDGEPPNNWAAIFGGSGWEYDPDLGQYYYHMFYKEQPDLNWRNPEVHQAMLDVFRFWLGKGVDGFRLDVFNAYFKDAAFRDNPSKLGIRAFDRQQHIHDASQPEMYPLIGEIRAIVDEHTGGYVVGETFLADTAQTATYCGKGKLHAAFNFEFAENRWHPKRFLDSAQKWYAALEENAWPNNFLSNHDMIRAASRYCFGEDDRRAKVALAMLLTIKGTPFIYYGEEIGMRDIPIRKKSDVLDPLGKTFWPFHKGRDGCRAPMQWTGGKNAGFSDAKPWLPVNQNYQERNVVNQAAEPDSVLLFFKSLAALRKAEPALQRGDFKALTTDPHTHLVFERILGGDRLVVMLNFNSREAQADLPEGQWQAIFGCQGTYENHLDLEPYQVVILKQP
ncbi:MAG: alpha-glucosidase [Anaerolineaceae bacterium]|nr:alpha-glucosidase [Anaerolineaceae bacterium]